MIKSINWQIPDEDFITQLRFLITAERLFSLSPRFKRFIGTQSGGSIMYTSDQVWIDEDGNAFYLDNKGSCYAW